MLILHALSRTTVGAWILSPPVLTTTQDGDEQIGRLILDALNGSRMGVAHPSHWDGFFDPVLKAASVRSWSAFARSAKCVRIEFTTNRISFVPMRNLGAKDGFVELASKTHSRPPVAHELGQGLLAAFYACE
jgi:hypothetical protein